MEILAIKHTKYTKNHVNSLKNTKLKRWLGICVIFEPQTLHFPAVGGYSHSFFCIQITDGLGVPTRAS